MTDLHHYRECGLENIYLANGFHVEAGGRGRTTFIEDREGLHRAIGEWLARHKKFLDGREARFLRLEMGLSQSALALLLGKDEQSIARWEKKSLASGQKIPPDSDRMVRYLYLQTVGSDTPMKEFLQALADLENVDPQWATFSETEAGWENAAGFLAAPPLVRASSLDYVPWAAICADRRADILCWIVEIDGTLMPGRKTAIYLEDFLKQNPHFFVLP